MTRAHRIVGTVLLMVGAGATVALTKGITHEIAREKAGGAVAKGNWADCVLERMPGVENDPAAYAVAQDCADKFGPPTAVIQASGDDGYRSGSECAAAKARSTRSARAAAAIRNACNRLYDPADPFDSSQAH